MAGDVRLLVRPAPPVVAAPAPVVWSPCPSCWGQRRLWTLRGDCYVPQTCGGCLGLGEVMA